MVISKSRKKSMIKTTWDVPNRAAVTARNIGGRSSEAEAAQQVTGAKETIDMYYYINYYYLSKLL